MNRVNEIRSTAAEKRGPIRRLIRRGRLWGRVKQQIATQSAAANMLEGQVRRSTARQMSLGGNTANMINLYGGDMVASARGRLLDLELRRRRILQGKPYMSKKG